MEIWCLYIIFIFISRPFWKGGSGYQPNAPQNYCNTRYVARTKAEAHLLAPVSILFDEGGDDDPPIEVEEMRARQRP